MNKQNPSLATNIQIDRGDSRTSPSALAPRPSDLL